MHAGRTLHCRSYEGTRTVYPPLAAPPFWPARRVSFLRCRTRDVEDARRGLETEPLEGSPATMPGPAFFVRKVCGVRGSSAYAEELETTLSTKGFHYSLTVLQASGCGIMHIREGRWVYAMIM